MFIYIYTYIYIYNLFIVFCPPTNYSNMVGRLSLFDRGVHPQTHTANVAFITIASG